MSIDLNLDEIEAAARAATPGHWESVEDAFSGDCMVVVAGPPSPGFTQYQVAPDVNGDRRGPEAEGASPQQNARHIATMDPPTTLALVAEARRLREGVGLPFPRSKLGALACAANMLERDGTPSRVEIATGLREMERALSAIPLSDDAQEGGG